jgi:hydrogenase maturation protease
MAHTLVMGFGNLDRADDGVAFYVVNELRRRLGQPPLSPDETGSEQLGGQHDSVFLRQLQPEWMETCASYDQLIFVDAHVNENTAELACVPVWPEYVSSPFTHHMTPPMFLALTRALYGREPAGRLVSIRGHDFDFHRGLSPAATGQVPAAVEMISNMLEEESPSRGMGAGCM